MKKIEINLITRKNIIKEYEERKMPVDKMPSKFGISQRVFYRILKEEGIDTNVYRKKNYITSPKHNLIGKKFFHLLVEKMEITDKSKDNTWRCICKCDCGRIADVNTNYLMKGLSKTCGNKKCEYHRQDYSNNGKNNVKFTGYEDISGQFWSSYKCGAEKRKIDFDIDIEYAWNIFLQQNKKCAITKKDIYFGRTNTSEKTASLDRIDSKKGYIKGNIQWVHKDINKMKMDLTFENFVNLCKLVANNN